MNREQIMKLQHGDVVFNEEKKLMKMFIQQTMRFESSSETSLLI